MSEIESLRRLVRQSLPVDKFPLELTEALYDAGLITGEALIGIFLARPLMIREFTPWKSIPIEFNLFETAPLGPWPGVLLLAGVVYLLYKVALRDKTNTH